MRSANWLATSIRHKRPDSTEPAVVSGDLSGDHTVARFIYSKRHFTPTTRRPKPGAFDPGKYAELSVAHSTGLVDSQVWPLAVATLVDEPGRSTVYARADILVRALFTHKLRAVRDDNPFERHSKILGWPEVNDQDKRKEQIKLICLQLSQCDEITLLIPGEPITRNSN
jgi:hypothetical protein